MPTTRAPLRRLPLLALLLALPVPAPAAPGPPGLARLFPDAREVGPGVTAGDLAEYGPETLYDYIDGGAEAYLDLGFARVGAREYVAPAGQARVSVTVDAFDMAEPVNAFGIYAAESHADVAPVDVGLLGRGGGGALAFLAGRFYVKLRADDEGVAVDRLLLDVARLVAARAGDPGKLPAELALLPARDRVKTSERYAARGLLGVGALRGFSARYAKDGVELALHLCPYGSEAEAEAAERALERRLRGGLTRKEDAPDASFDDRFLGRGRLLRSGPVLAVAPGLPADPKAAAWAVGLVDELFKAAGKAGIP